MTTVVLTSEDEVVWRARYGKAEQAAWFEANGIQIRSVVSGSVVVDPDGGTITYDEIARGEDGRVLLRHDDADRPVEPVISRREVPLQLPLPAEVPWKAPI